MDDASKNRMRQGGYKIRLAFCWDWPCDPVQLLTWGDGLAAALREIKKEWDLRCYSIGQSTVVFHPYFNFILRPTPEELAKKVLEDKPDVILFFADLTRPTIPYVAQSGISMALCYAGGTFREYVDAFKLFFVESKVYEDTMRSEGLNVRQAFGTNTSIFKPIQQPKIWDAIFPATFALWKRHKLFSEALGNKGLAVGFLYHTHEQECWQFCQKYGTAIIPHVSANALAYLYNMAHTCVITSDRSGGSQRTVLEAMACNVPVITMNDSEKTSEFVLESGLGEVVEPNITAIRDAVRKWKETPINSRDWIVQNYSEFTYAEKLKEGILSIV